VGECHLGQFSFAFAGVDAAFVVGNGGDPGAFAVLFHGQMKKAAVVRLRLLFSWSFRFSGISRGIGDQQKGAGFEPAPENTYSFRIAG
jgi:hypothetical protein